MIPLFDDLPKSLSDCVQELQRIPGWQTDWGKDSALVTDLARLYPQVDLPREAVEMRIWLLDNKPQARANHRRRFRNWVKRSDEWRTKRDRSRYRAHREAEIEGHGDSVRARREW